MKKEEMLNKTVYVTQETLDALQEKREGEEQEKFNFSKRVNSLIKLGLMVEGLDTKEGQSKIDRAIELVKLGIDTEKKLTKNNMSLAIVIDYLVRTYNKSHADNPIIITIKE